jgi:hypothetical protein
VAGVKLLALCLIPIANLAFTRVRLDRFDLILKRMP